MIIEFYKIRGIDEKNIFKFDSAKERYDFLSNYRTLQLSDVNFPFFYKNTIRLPIDNNEILNSNYCCIFETNDIYVLNNAIALESTFQRFYFIENFEYITESVYNVALSIDSIQTYMFDTSIYISYVKRRTIRRYNEDGTINRNYIRENLSKTENYTTEFKERKLKTALLVKWGFNEEMNREDKQYPFVSDAALLSTLKYNSSSNDGFNSNFLYTLFPLYKEEPPTWSYHEKTLTQYNFKFNNDILPWCSAYNIKNDNPYILSINVINLYDLPNITIYENDLTYEFDPQSYGVLEIKNSFISVPDTQDQTCIFIKSLEFFNFTNTIHIYNPFAFNKGTSLTTFSWHNIPQLLDENYCIINYGKIDNFATYPSHFLNNVNIIGYQAISLDNNSSLYALAQDNIDKDPYTSGVASKISTTLTLKNDAWNTWLANHSATLEVANEIKNINLIRGLGNTAIQSLTQLLSAGIITGFGTIPNPIGGVFASGASSTAGTGVVNSVADYMNAEQRIKEMTENNQSVPSGFRNMENSIASTLMQTNANIVAIQTKEDIQAVGQIYNMYGFKVSEVDDDMYGLNLSGYFNRIHNHYYFDYIECDLLSFTLSKYSTQKMKSNILRRMSNGVRIWYNPTSDQNIQAYNNVNDEI